MKTRRRTVPIITTAVAAALGLSSCTAHLDMTIDPSNTYDATLVLRDTTGSVLTADTDCQDYADPSVVGTSDGADVTATPIGSADDSEGVGCEVKATGVRIPDADEAGSSGTVPLVMRDGDLYIATVSPIDTGLDAAPSASGAAPAPDGAEGEGPTATSTEPLATAVNARLSITFPGAVVDAGGGSVSGRTVTWEGTDTLTSGVIASGYATPEEGLGFLDRFRLWIAAGAAAAGLVAGAAVVVRRRRSAAGRATRGSAEERRPGPRKRGSQRTER